MPTRLLGPFSVSAGLLNIGHADGARAPFVDSAIGHQREVKLAVLEQMGADKREVAHDAPARAEIRSGFRLPEDMEPAPHAGNDRHER